MDAKDRQVPEGATRVFEGEIFSVWQYPQALFDGSVATFEYVERVDAAGAVGVLDNGKILMVHDEQPQRGPLVGAAGGRVEPGESPEEAVRREFLEETGYEIGRLDFWFSAGWSDKLRWQSHFFVAKDLRKVAEPELEAGERIELREYSFEEFLELGRKADLRNTHFRIELLQALLDEGKKMALYGRLYE